MVNIANDMRLRLQNNVTALNRTLNFSINNYALGGRNLTVNEARPKTGGSGGGGGFGGGGGGKGRGRRSEPRW